MNLQQRVVVREELDDVFLYNGDNGGLIRLTRTAYVSYVVNDTVDQYYEELYAWLNRSGFLAEGSKRNLVECDVPVENTSQNALFRLRSNRNPINVLWALTPQCNLRCVYCFPDAKMHSLHYKNRPLSELLTIAEQLVSATVFKVTLSGGECLLLDSTLEIAAHLRNAGTTVAIISNGTTITDDIACHLKKIGVVVGVSLDSCDPDINAITRGSGVFARTVRGIEKLLLHGVHTTVLITLNRYNYPSLHQHFNFLSEIGIRNITLQDLRPFGSKANYDATRLTVEQERELPETYMNIKADFPHMAVNPTELFVFSKPYACGTLMQCPAGDNFAYIDFFGDVFPCTSLPSFKMGNLFAGTATLTELWRSSPAIAKLRQIKSLPLEHIADCRSCSNSSCCDGGCRGDALFYDDNLMGVPSRCPKRLGILG